MNSLSFNDFAMNLLREIGVSPRSPLSMATTLSSDLALDSIEMAQVMLVIEQLAGTDATELPFTVIETVGDAFDLYLSLTR